MHHWGQAPVVHFYTRRDYAVETHHQCLTPVVHFCSK